MAEQSGVEQIATAPAFPPSYAERLASVETYVAGLATKADVAELRTEVVELKIEVVTSRAEAKADNAALRDELKADNAALTKSHKEDFGKLDKDLASFRAATTSTQATIYRLLQLLCAIGTVVIGLLVLLLRSP